MAALLLLRRAATQRAKLVRPLSTAPFKYQELFDLEHDTKTPYKKLTSDYVSTFKVRFACSR